MPAPPIAVAADHAGFELKATLKQKLEECIGGGQGIARALESL
jgi:ribose 5-phosphate isomerase RpiB